MSYNLRIFLVDYRYLDALGAASCGTALADDVPVVPLCHVVLLCLEIGASKLLQVVQ